MMYTKMINRLSNSINQLNEEIENGDYDVDNIYLSILKVEPVSDKMFEVIIEVCNKKDNTFSYRYFTVQDQDLVGYKVWLAINDVLEVGDFE